jgi:hypothetical protein
VDRLNWGAERLDPVIVRDCPRFRHDQTVLNIHLYTAFDYPHVHDLDRFGGWQSPHDHPEQVIWGHRRRGDYRFLPRVPYRFPVVLVGLPWGVWRYLSQNRGWLFRPWLVACQISRLLGRVSRRG